MNQTAINAVIGISLIVSLLAILHVVNRDKFMTIKSLRYDPLHASSRSCMQFSSIVGRSPTYTAVLADNIMNAFNQEKKNAYDMTCALCGGASPGPQCNSESVRRWAFANCA